MGVQCNAMQKVHSLYVILQCIALDRLCNAMQHVIPFNEHGKELVLVCNAMQKEHNLYVIFQCTTLDR